MGKNHRQAVLGALDVLPCGDRPASQAGSDCFIRLFLDRAHHERNGLIPWQASNRRHNRLTGFHATKCLRGFVYCARFAPSEFPELGASPAAPEFVERAVTANPKDQRAGIGMAHDSRPGGPDPDEGLSEILAVASAVPRGPEGEMRSLAIGECGAILFVPAETVTGLHVAFRVDEVTFAGLVDRLRAKRIAFGNHPERSANGESNDPFGGHGRVYFANTDGHFYEVIA